MKMKIRRTIPDWILEGISLLVIIGTTSISSRAGILFQTVFPYIIMQQGRFDRWGGKGELIFLFVMTWILYIGITLIQRFPQIWNTGVQVTQENRERVYRTLMYMLETLKLLMVAGLTFLTVYSMDREKPACMVSVCIYRRAVCRPYLLDGVPCLETVRLRSAM